MVAAEPSGRVVLRLATAGDHEAVKTAFLHAMCWSDDEPRTTLERILEEDERNHRYISGWGRRQDIGVIAHDARGHIGGAAWLRQFTADAPGYGYVGPDIPEMSIGLSAGWRHRGVGTRLILRLHEEASRRGITRLSLSVEAGNPAVTLYERLGYVRVAEVAEDASMTMITTLQ